MIEALLNECPGVRFLRDPTRGGVASTLNEIAASSGLSLVIDEQALPISEGVRGFCDALGLDPLYVANEGKVVVVVAPDEESRALEVLRSHPLGRQAQSLGVAEEAPRPSVRLRTAMGGSRLVEMLSGDQLPRIC
jgi:hydrogenase expression/formation protein HypE